ncbi:hypothetical protein M3I53_01145 [Paraburkholderia sp. CNPSo 3272]|uniref:hypothetical protein n=1 Tax=Paraburkholderia sp. CNPSo 3272 TaxID=2940931 RepID=UPI0020B677B9|nr:hypothetical protein [Paraburkholderia sp. CNPSo 3272]MCP3721742.1 hypothetical protein [Paraburkholderia sp. CNPSo 3272]
MFKVFFQKIASWFGIEVKTIDHDDARIASYGWALTENGVLQDEKTLGELTSKLVPANLSAIIDSISDNPFEGMTMSTPEATPAPPATTNTNVDNAIKIALFLKSFDANLTDAAVQAGTNAALATLYPAD